MLARSATEMNPPTPPSAWLSSLNRNRRIELILVQIQRIIMLAVVQGITGPILSNAVSSCDLQRMPSYISTAGANVLIFITVALIGIWGLTVIVETSTDLQPKELEKLFFLLGIDLLQRLLMVFIINDITQTLEDWHWNWQFGLMLSTFIVYGICQFLYGMYIWQCKRLCKFPSAKPGIKIMMLSYLEIGVKVLVIVWTVIEDSRYHCKTSASHYIATSHVFLIILCLTLPFLVTALVGCNIIVNFWDVESSGRDVESSDRNVESSGKNVDSSGSDVVFMGVHHDKNSEQKEIDMVIVSRNL